MSTKIKTEIMRKSKVYRSPFCLALFVFLALSFRVTYGAEKTTLETDTKANQGKALYFKKGCDVCHGYVGQGWAGGKRLAEPVLPLTAFKTLIRRPVGSMPPYSPEVLTDGELEAIHQFLELLRSPDAKDIPLLQRR